MSAIRQICELLARKPDSFLINKETLVVPHQLWRDGWDEMRQKYGSPLVDGNHDHPNFLVMGIPVISEALNVKASPDQSA